MKFHLTSAAGNLFTGYGPGYVDINRERHEGNLIVTVNGVEENWLPGGFESLTAETFADLLRFEPEVVVLGTGSVIRFPHPRLTAPLAAAHVGIEVMDVQAACRTFNVLSAEERKVLAALILTG
jgi:uncharacterized protein